VPTPGLRNVQILFRVKSIALKVDPQLVVRCLFGPIVHVIDRQRLCERKERMKMNSRTMLVCVASVLGILATVNVSRAQFSGDPAPPEVRKAVLARLAEIQTAAESLNVEKVFSYVAENDQGSLVQNGRLLLTRKEALESTRLGFQGLQSLEYRFDEQRITLLSPTVALATGEGASSGMTADGRTLKTRFAQSIVFVLADGEWKVFHAHRSFPGAN